MSWSNPTTELALAEIHGVVRRILNHKKVSEQDKREFIQNAHKVVADLAVSKGYNND